MTTILLDTDVLIDFFRGYSEAVVFVNTYNDRIILSSIVVAELFAGVKGDTEQAALQDFISLFRVVPVNTEIGKPEAFTSEIMVSHMALVLRMPSWLQLRQPKTQS